MRKMHLAMRAKALVVFPGGFGTFDELFEMLNLVQTGKMRPRADRLLRPPLLDRASSISRLLAEEGMIARDDLDLFTFADDAEEAWRILIARGLKIPPATPSKAEEPPVGRDV